MCIINVSVRSKDVYIWLDHLTAVHHVSLLSSRYMFKKVYSCGYTYFDARLVSILVNAFCNNVGGNLIKYIDNDLLSDIKYVFQHWI